MIGPYVFITTEAFSESKTILKEYIQVTVEILRFVQMSGLAHSNILPGVKIGSDSSTGAGSVITQMFQVSRWLVILQN